MPNLLNLLASELIFNKTLAIVVVSFLMICIASFAGLFIYWTLQFNKTGSNVYSFTRYLPFELNRFRRSSKTRALDLGWLILNLILFVIPMIAFAAVSNTPSSYILMVFMAFAVIVFGLLMFTKLSNYKAHLVLVSMFVGFVSLILVLEMLYFGTLDYGYVSASHKEIAYINIAIVMILLIFELVLVLNPTYKGWAKMKQMGAETFNRPKYCYIAMLEWGTFLTLILSYIPIIIATFF